MLARLIDPAKLVAIAALGVTFWVIASGCTSEPEYNFTAGDIEASEVIITATDLSHGRDDITWSASGEYQGTSVTIYLFDDEADNGYLVGRTLNRGQIFESNGNLGLLCRDRPVCDSLMTELIDIAKPSN